MLQLHCTELLFIAAAGLFQFLYADHSGIFLAKRDHCVADQICLLYTSISISNEYQPSQFRKNKYNEHVLLQDLEQYQFYSTLTKECFLYYGGNTIFHASGYTMDLNTYLKTLSVKERGRMWEKLEDIRDAAAAGDLSLIHI